MPITVTNLTCVYGAGTPFETTALRDVSVTVENGSFVGILGRTGCGKSTLIQIVAGLLTPTAGTVMLDGQDIHPAAMTAASCGARSASCSNTRSASSLRRPWKRTWPSA